VFSIELERHSYAPGRIVKGNIVISVDSELKLRNIRFTAYGKEKIRIKEPITGDWSTSWDEIKEDYAFFEKDLSYYLESTVRKLPDEEKYILAKGSWSIPFEFPLPKDGYESYFGKNVSIEYGIQALADLVWKENVVEETTFEVHYDGDPKRKTLTGNRWWEEHSGKKVKKDHANEILEILQKNAYSPGDIIAGRINLRRLKTMPTVIRISLRAIEFATATKPYSRESIVEEYNQKIETQERGMQT
jgi:hypothetical protein